MLHTGTHMHMHTHTYKYINGCKTVSTVTVRTNGKEGMSTKPDPEMHCPDRKRQENR